MIALLASLTLAFTPAQAQVRPGCPKTFTEPMITRAIDAAYAGTRTVTGQDRAQLSKFIRCARNTDIRSVMHRYWNHAWRAWYQRVHPPMFNELASWYNDAGGTACGFHATYGVANKKLPCGTHVLVRYGDRQVTMIVQDRGPYVGGRVWDLNQGTAGAIGFDGVGYVQVSVSGQ